MPKLPAISRLAAAVFAACAFSAASAASVPQSAKLFASAQQVAGSAYLAQVSLNQAALLSAKAGQAFQLSLPGIGQFEVIHDATVPRNGGMQWMGHLKEGVEYSVVLQTSAEGVTGQIRTPQGAFRLGHANGGEWLAREGVAGSVGESIATLPRMFAMTAAPDTAAAQPGSRDTATRSGPPSKASYPVAFNVVAMSDLKAGDEVSIDVPGRGSYRVAYENTVANDSGSSTWVGYLKDYGNDFRVMITTDANGSVGNILTPSGDLALTTVGSQQWLVDRAASGWTQLHATEGDGVSLATASGGMAAGGTAKGGTSTTSATTAAATTSSGATQIDVLVLYTPGFVTVNGSNWQARLDQLVALANQAYVDSGINIQLRAVATSQINLSDQTSNSTTLSDLTNASGAFSGVPALRKQYGADLVTLVRPFYMTAQGQNCGVGYIGGYGGTNIAQYAGYAYSVVSDGHDVTGQSYYCTDYTFAHELGHNMGDMHDRATVTAQGGGTGAYPYSFGYGKSGSFGTVMSYISPVIGKFSNPAVTTCGSGVACGVSSSDTANSADNAMSMNNTATAVSAYYSTTAAVTYQITGVVSLNGSALTGVSLGISGSGASCTASASNGTYSCSVPSGWSGTVTPSLSGYSFTPTSLSYSSLAASQTNQNYTATAKTTTTGGGKGARKISGKIVGRGSVSGVSFSISGSGASCTASDSGGNYSCTVPDGWTGVIRPSASKARFTPWALGYRPVARDIGSQNYLKY